ncbi:PepSY domain-containing protein [Saccharopolyspora gloriosae]|uniref:PepSY-associated TM helix domain-containing protein n=1 Tax=Saccharopolyspora gloriosae TaxID=455344 RepID=UPI001FB58643|nr:PepSY domain-containing protein [Saccharopolyspora gloriosae]
MVTSTGQPARPEEEPQHTRPNDATDVPGATTPRSGVAALARRVHFLAGLAVAPFLVIMCLTGLANAFTPQIVDAVHGRELYAETEDGPTQAVSGQVAAAVAAHPEGTVTAVIPPSAPDRTTQVVLSVPGLPDTDAFSDEDLTVYVDPYTDQVQGELITVKNRPPAQTWLRHAHGNLHLGPPGRIYSEFATSWVPIVVVGGLVLWAARRRSRGAPPSSRPATTTETRLRGLHGWLGLCLSVGLVVLAITGFSQSNYVGDRVDQLFEAVDSSEPSLEAGKVAVPPGATPIDVDSVLRVAGAEGLRGELTVTPPAEPGEVFQAEETGVGWPVQRDALAVDPYTGRITERVAFADHPLPAKLNIAGVQLHDGTLFGVANQVVVVLLALGTLVLVVLAYRMWWNRRNDTGLPPAPRPVWRSLPRTALVVLMLGTALLAWAMPVLGVSLIGFLLLDALLGAARRRSRPRT